MLLSTGRFVLPFYHIHCKARGTGRLCGWQQGVELFFLAGRVQLRSHGVCVVSLQVSHVVSSAER